MATSVLGLKTFAASDPVDYNEINDNYNKIDNGVKTALQGRAAHNLLDNSWFVNPVNQRGRTSYTGVANASVYTIDRWLFSWQGGAVLTVGDGYIQHNGYKLQQYFEKSLDTNKTYTAALCLTDGTIYVYSGKPSDGFGSWDNTIWVSSSYFRIEKGMAQPIKWAALYEGSYDASTLPAYQPKGYAAELAECMRYYRRFINSAPAMSIAATAIEAEMPLEPPMRVVPTITINSVGSAYTPEGAKSVSGSYSATNTVNKAGYVFYTPSIGIGLPCVITGIDGYLSADL